MDNHINFNFHTLSLSLLDQRHLPAKETYFICRTWRDVQRAIKNMVVRGAPAIGVTAAFGCVLALAEYASDAQWMQKTSEALKELAKARPTAVNLSWAIDRMLKIMNYADFSSHELLNLWLEEAKAIQIEDEEICRAIGKAGAVLIKPGDTILTHCNAGALATAGYGTALGVIRAACEEGKSIKVIADETRPLFQGARLTAWELMQDGIPVTITCDNACALLMSRGTVQLVITGADRIAANGDTANKIGTYGVALLANHFNLPFYIAAPLSTIDTSLSNGSLIPIEERSSDEVREYCGQPIAPPKVPVYNFAFDVTPASLITGIITEKGVLYPPYEESIAHAFNTRETQ